MDRPAHRDAEMGAAGGGATGHHGRDEEQAVEEGRGATGGAITSAAEGAPGGGEEAAGAVNVKEQPGTGAWDAAVEATGEMSAAEFGAAAVALQRENELPI